MLVLSRKPTEVVVIDDKIRVTVVSVSGETVRLGFEAPTPITIAREEIAAAFRGSASESVEAPKAT